MARSLPTPRPDGYPELNLAARTLRLRFRKDANVERLSRRLEAWEHERGNTKFRSYNLSRLPVATAFELVHVYVSLRERYPGVRPDFIDFSSSDPDQSLAWAYSYSDAFPHLREIAATIDGGMELDGAGSDKELIRRAREESGDPGVARRVRGELSVAHSTRVLDLSATGAIEIGKVFRTRRAYRELLAFWEKYDARAARMGRPRRSPDMVLSPVAATLVHEFGHLVEAELLNLGFDSVERTYRDLSVILLGSEPRSPLAWRYHLINYPTYAHTSMKGPVTGSKARGKATRKALKAQIGEKIGSYAPTTRDEIFAESFSVAHGARSAQLRREFDPFLARLRSEGLAVSRLPRRTT